MKTTLRLSLKKKLTNLFLTKVLIGGIIVLMSSCYRHYSIIGNGHLRSQDRGIYNFNKIHCDGDISVYFINDSATALTVEAEENLLPYIETYVSGNTLIIKEASHLNLRPERQIKVFVKAPWVDEIELCGSGYIHCDSINSSTLDFNISGSGDVFANVYANFFNAKISGSGKMDLAGNADISEIKISGSGKILAYGLIQNTCYTTTSGSGDMYIHVNDLLDAEISGSGRVYYSGNPIIKSRISGSGSIIPRY